LKDAIENNKRIIITTIQKFPFICDAIADVSDWAFSGCSSLTEVRIPKGCYVDEEAFVDCPNFQISRY
jgi:type I site-specific restriction-modification system R (restriction) subunit